MTQQHPITPPPELVQQWRAAASNVPATLSTDLGGRHDYIDFIANRAAQWGADQELEACCEWVSQWRCLVGGSRPEVGLRAARRPKPPSLKEQALLAIDTAVADYRIAADVADVVRRALEQLPDNN
jgi:hypothetical protein